MLYTFTSYPGVRKICGFIRTRRLKRAVGLGKKLGASKRLENILIYQL